MIPVHEIPFVLRCFKMFLIYIVDNLGYILIILYIVDIL